MPQNSLNNSNLGLSGAHGVGYMALVATTWVRRVVKYPYFHQVITQTHPRGDERVSEKVEI